MIKSGTLLNSTRHSCEYFSAENTLAYTDLINKEITIQCHRSEKVTATQNKLVSKVKVDCFFNLQLSKNHKRLKVKIMNLILQRHIDILDKCLMKGYIGTFMF